MPKRSEGGCGRRVCPESGLAEHAGRAGADVPKAAEAPDDREFILRRAKKVAEH